MREAIELHDSKVLSLDKTDDGICLTLEAYIHRAPENQGERGTGCSQEVEFHLDDVYAADLEAEFPLWIMDGSVSGSESYDNLIPLPCEIDGDLQFEVDGAEGHLVIRATYLLIHRVGEPRFLEDTPADFYP